MNFKITTLLFGLLLGALWIFGLILALGKTTLDQSLVFPKFAREVKGSIVSVEIAKDGKKYLFTNKDGTRDGWRLSMPPNEQSVRVSPGEVEGLVEDLRSAHHSNEETDINRNLSDPRWGLTSPKMTVTVKSDKGEEWQLFVGNEREDKSFVYVNSSDRPRDVLAVRRAAMPRVFFDDIDSFRLRRLLEAKEVSVRHIDLKETRADKVTELILDKSKDKPWWFEKPKLGPADFEGGAPALPSPVSKAADEIQSVRTLIATLTNLRVEEFEPISSTQVVDGKNAILRIELGYEQGASDKEDGDKNKEKEKPNLKKEVLLIGPLVPGKDADKQQYFARLEGDSSVVHVSAKQLEPVFALLKDPRPLRSHDVSQIDPNTVDAVKITRGPDTLKLFKREEMFKFEPAWRVFPSKGDPKTANATAITGPTGLLQAIVGKNEIKDKDFQEADTPEAKKKLESEFAVTDKLLAVVTVWSDSLKPAPEKKDDKKLDKKEETKADKKEEKKADDKDKAKIDDKGKAKTDDKDKAKVDKKDDKKVDDKDKGKADKKDEAKAEKKDGKDKKDDKQEDKAEPEFKKDAKEIVQLLFAKADKDKVLVKRQVPDTDPIYFYLAMADFEKIAPPEMALAFFDTNISPFNSFDAFKLEIVRGSLKDRETFLLERELPKDKDDKKKEDKKDGAKKEDLKKEDQKDGAKKDDKKDEKALDWKLKEPKEFSGKGEVEQSEVDRVVRQLATLHAERWVRKVGKDGLAEFGLDAPNIVTSVTFKKKEGDKDETKTCVLKIGNKSRLDKDKNGYYAIQDGTDIVFVIPSQLEKSLEDAEFRDRQVMKFDVKDVKEVRLWMLSKDEVEVRDPVFEREKDKAWKIKSGLGKLNLDVSRVDELVDKMSDLKCVRYLNVKMPAPKDYRLEGDKVPLKIEFVMNDGKKHWITIGARQEKDGAYYATSSAMPGLVFLVPAVQVEQLLSGNVSYFSRQ